MGDPAARDKPYEADDPMELVPVSFPTATDETADRETARCFVEEFALQGWPSTMIRELFHSPHYKATYTVFRRRGSAFVDEVLADVLGSERGS